MSTVSAARALSARVLPLTSRSQSSQACSFRRIAERSFHRPTWPSVTACIPHHKHHIHGQRRHKSDDTSLPLTDRETEAPPSNKAREEQPSYEMTFTCRKCVERSTHRISKQGYHHGTILITCPGCKNRHLISDHLKIFSDKSVTIEDILREKGQLMKRGTLGADGDVEFWEDGSETPRQK